MRWISYIAVFVMCASASAQQIPQFTLWSQNSYLLNPAVTGISKKFDIRTGFRYQWLGMDGAPNTGYLSAHGAIENRKAGYLSPWHGIGGRAERDVAGGFSNFTVGLSYAFHIPMGKSETLSFGTRVEAQQLGFDQINATTIDPDVAIATNVSNFLFPRLSFGVWYAREFIYGGVSIDQLARNKWEDIGFESRFLVHANITGGLKYTNAKDISFLPKFVLRFGPNAPISADIQTLFDFQNKFALGLGYRTQDALSAIIKIKPRENVSIAYSYDFTLSPIRVGTFGGHEIMLAIRTGRNNYISPDDTPLFE